MITVNLKSKIQSILALGFSFMLSACNSSEELVNQESLINSNPATQKQAVHYSPNVNRRYPNQVYFGDTHLHSSNSGDAFAYGARLSPADAYRFARGEVVESTTGQPAKLSRPLDFLVVADHAEGLGVMQGLLEGHPLLSKDPQLTRWKQMLSAGDREAQKATREIINGLANKTLPEAISNPKLVAPFARSIWQDYLETADRYYSPGKFTSLIGYEFTSQPMGDNMHRVVIFRDDAEKVKSILPFSSLMSEDPEDLWASLDKYEQKTGGKALAIPHNSNLSNGRMFALVDFEGSAIDVDYASKRARWEPLVEATQIKGDSESHSFLSPNDEYAGFGDAGWEQGNLTLQTVKTNDMFAGDYVREGLKRGLLLEQQTGSNPYKFGLIGSTDSHTGLSTGDENNFFGKNKQMEPRPDRISKVYKKSKLATIYGWQYLAGGYAAVWAIENTREALFDAMMRKEVYATTGPRIKLRFFGGFDFQKEMQFQPDIAPIGYEKGVPMGGDLINSEGQKAPQFLLRAQKDPDGLNLALLQVIKGSIDENGQLHERVYDVAEAELASGNSELSAFWQDPNFNASLTAFYYVRVLEIPGDRWPSYDAKYFGIKLPYGATEQSQERAYSSPIWYQPSLSAQ